VNALAKGNMPDACTTVGSVEQSRTDNTFNVKIGTVRPADRACAEVLTPFEQNVPLDVARLQAGTYIVDVNGITETFELQTNNVLP
jgi:inhibitor of cysteine peptidase